MWLNISWNSSITETSPLDCLVSYIRTLVGIILPYCRDAVGVLYSPSCSLDHLVVLNNSKFAQVFRTFLSILTEINSAMIWMDPVLSLISKSPSHLTRSYRRFKGHHLWLQTLSSSCYTVFVCFGVCLFCFFWGFFFAFSSLAIFNCHDYYFIPSSHYLQLVIFTEVSVTRSLHRIISDFKGVVGID